MTGQHADTDLRILIDKSLSHRISVKIMYRHHISIGKCPHNRINLIIKNPCATRLDRAAFSLFKVTIV